MGARDAADPFGRMLVTVTFAEPSDDSESLVEVAERLLSGFPFDHKIVFPNGEARR